MRDFQKQQKVAWGTLEGSTHSPGYPEGLEGKSSQAAGDKGLTLVTPRQGLWKEEGGRADTLEGQD